MPNSIRFTSPTSFLENSQEITDRTDPHARAAAPHEHLELTVPLLRRRPLWAIGALQNNMSNRKFASAGVPEQMALNQLPLYEKPCQLLNVNLETRLFDIASAFVQHLGKKFPANFSTIKIEITFPGLPRFKENTRAYSEVNHESFNDAHKSATLTICSSSFNMSLDQFVLDVIREVSLQLLPNMQQGQRGKNRIDRKIGEMRSILKEGAYHHDIMRIADEADNIFCSFDLAPRSDSPYVLQPGSALGLLNLYIHGTCQELQKNILELSKMGRPLNKVLDSVPRTDEEREMISNEDWSRRLLELARHINSGLGHTFFRPT